MQTLNERRTFFMPVIAIVVALVFVFTGIPTTASYAVTSEEKQAEADAIFARIDELQTDLNIANEQYEYSTWKVEEANKAMDDAAQRAKQAESRVAELQETLSRRATEMYKFGGSASFLSVLLGSSSFSEFIEAWNMTERVATANAELVNETKNLREQAQAAHAEYEAQRSVAQEEAARAKAAADAIEANKAELTEEANRITAEVAELQAEEEAQAAAAAAAAAAAEAAQAQINAANGYSAGESVVSGTGEFANPCPAGYLSSGFGYRDFDSAFHKGIDLAASEGTPYYAADSGTVIYATHDGGYNGGAGNWIVISHGNGLVTKYMHSSAVYVNVGDTVYKGQNIGAVGNTGNSFGAHLHFQVELNGAAVNPYNYL